MPYDEGVNRDKCPHCKRSLFGKEYFYVAIHKNGYMRLLKTECAARRAAKNYDVKIVKFEQLEDFKPKECK